MKKYSLLFLCIFFWYAQHSFSQEAPSINTEVPDESEDDGWGFADESENAKYYSAPIDQEDMERDKPEVNYLWLDIEDGRISLPTDPVINNGLCKIISEKLIHEKGTVVFECKGFKTNQTFQFALSKPSITEQEYNFEKTNRAFFGRVSLPAYYKAKKTAPDLSYGCRYNNVTFEGKTFNIDIQHILTEEYVQQINTPPTKPNKPNNSNVESIPPVEEKKSESTSSSDESKNIKSGSSVKISTKKEEPASPTKSGGCTSSNPNSFYFLGLTMMVLFLKKHKIKFSERVV